MSRVINNVEMARLNATGDYRIPAEEIDVSIGQPDRFGKCRILAKWEGGDHHDLGNPFEAWRRKAFGEAVAVKTDHVNDDGEPEADFVLAIGNRIVAAANEPSEEVIEPEHFECLTAAQFDAGEYETSYHIDGIVPVGQPLVIGAQLKTMKSTVAESIAWSIATGDPLFGQYQVTNPARVFHANAESVRRGARCFQAHRGIIREELARRDRVDDLPACAAVG